MRRVNVGKVGVLFNYRRDPRPVVHIRARRTIRIDLGKPVVSICYYDDTRFHTTSLFISIPIPSRDTASILVDADWSAILKFRGATRPSEDRYHVQRIQFLEFKTEPLSSTNVFKIK